jgi:hypothetical protein
VIHLKELVEKMTKIIILLKESLYMIEWDDLKLSQKIVLKYLRLIKIYLIVQINCLNFLDFSSYTFQELKYFKELKILTNINPSAFIFSSNMIC